MQDHRSHKNYLCSNSCLNFSLEKRFSRSFCVATVKSSTAVYREHALLQTSQALFEVMGDFFRKS